MFGSGGSIADRLLNVPAAAALPWFPGPGIRWSDTKSMTAFALLISLFMTGALIRGTIRSSRPGGFFRQSRSVAVFYTCFLTPIYLLILFSIVTFLHTLFQ